MPKSKPTTASKQWKRIASGLLISQAFLLPQTGAQLQFEKVNQELKARPGDETVTAVFKFRNAGLKPVEIDRLKSSCDCTTAELKKIRYQPGETGEIRSVFTIGDRVGEQFKQVSVYTKEKSEAVRLSFHVRLPDLAEITPVAVFWDREQKPETQTIQIRCAEKEFPADSFKAAAMADRAEVQVRALEKGRSYRIEVRPRSTAFPWREEIAVDVTFPGLGARHYKVYAYVK